MAGSEEIDSRKGQLDARRALLLKRLQAQKGSTDPEVRIKPQAGDDPLPLSYTQQRVWFLQQLYPHNRAYNMSEAWRVRGPLDVQALQQALQEVIRRHASLRTRFVTVEDEPRQEIAADLEVELHVSDLSHLSKAAREELIPQMVLGEGNYAFDLSHAPLFRPSLIRLEDEDHVLQLVLHHIITDEWSNDLIWRDLNTYYTKFTGDSAPEPAAIPIQYADYALWQREQVAAGALQEQMDYWQNQLSGELPLLQLPFDRPRGSGQSLRGGILRRMLPPDLLAGLKALGQEAGTSLNMTLLAAFQALLQRTSGQEDILVGTPIANRQRLETKDVTGMFINTAVIRSQLPPDLTFRQLLDQVQGTVTAALANQDLPFDLLVQAMHPDRDLSYNPLFQCMFVFRAEGTERSLPSLAFAPIQIDRGVAKFDLTLFAGEAEGRLYSAIEYSSDLFEPTTIERMLDHWQNLLRALLANPGQTIGSLSIMGTYERELVTRGFNKTVVPLPAQQALHEKIGEQASKTPQALAVISEHERLTYAELDARANRLAQRLVQQDIQLGTPVGLFVERSAAMIVGILGILKAGAAYVPLAPEYPQERIAFALADTGAPVIVCQEHLRRKLPQTSAEIMVLEEGLAIESGWSSAPPETAAGLDDLAYIIYTSGSTGTPKGVMVNHGNLLASTAARHIYYDEPLRRFLLLSSFAFDSSIAGIFWTLSSGGALVLPAPDDEKDVQKLSSIIAREQVSHTLALPSLYRLLLSYAPPERLDSLRAVIVAGEACPPDLGELHYQRLPQTALYNEYGPTEATVWCSVYRLPRIAGSRPVPIGRPVANSQLYILDAQQQPLPIGVPGELYVGGSGVTPGYWNNPQLTAERFPTLDWLPADNDRRVYRTGDLARWRADGQIEFLGRVDNQVKIRGFRIEPEEIEARLIQHSAVQEAAVIVAGGSPRSAAEKSLVAYVVLKNGSDPGLLNRTTLRVYLGDRLPEYMVPAHISFLPSLPRTPNGKLDPNRLPAPELDSARAIVPPRTPVEQKLAQIWGEILNLPAVSIEDKFFDLGGDSIMSIQVIARARQEGLTLTPRQMFEEQTIARLAAVAGTGTVLEAEPGEASGPLPLAPIQRWFFTQPLVDPAHWNQAAWFEAPRSINLEHLNAALTAVVAHHPLLRAQFCSQGSTWQQEIMPETAPAELALVSLADLDPEAQDAAMLATANSLHGRLNLSAAPLLRGALFDLGQRRAPRLLLIIHHLVVDAVSWHLIAADLATAYQQRIAGNRAALTPPPATYAQWSRSLSKMARSGELQPELPFWSAQGAVDGRLPRDLPDGQGNTEGHAQRLSVSLDSDRTAHLLTGVHAAYNTRIDDLLLTALVRAMANWTGKRTLLLSLERHGRESFDPRIDVSNTVGWFTALFPLALALDDSHDPGANIRAIKEQLRAVPRGGAGYGVLRYLGDDPIQQQLAFQPGPEILFNYLGQAGGQAQGDQPLRRLMAPTGQAYGPQNERAHLIDINAHVVDGRLAFNWQYAPAIFHAATILELAKDTIDELSLLVDHCLQLDHSRPTPSDFPLAALDQENLDQLSRQIVMKKVAGIYPLSPMQTLMLLHAKTAGGEHDVLFNQIVYEINGDLDREAYRRAWQMLVKRHAVLRTLFIWPDGQDPLQVVHETASLSWTEHDWRDRSAAEQESSLQDRLHEDRVAGFDLRRAPLMRLQLIRRTDDACWLVWSSHHLIIDRWCIGILFAEIKTLYEAYRRGEQPSLPPAPRYRDYIAWLGQQDEEKAGDFWRDTLRDLKARPLPLRDPEQGSAPLLDTVKFTLDPAQTAALRRFASGHNLTLSTLLNGAWAIIISRMSGSADVLFGVTVSGRPPELPQTAETIGSFINNVPFRATLAGQSSLVEWLAGLQDRQLALQTYEYASPAQIQEWSGLKTAGPLFDTLVVYQAPVDLPQPPGLDLHFARGGMQTGYPLTLGVVPREEGLRLTLTYDQQRLAAETAAQIREALLQLLPSFTNAPDTAPTNLRDALPGRPIAKSELAPPALDEAAQQTFVPPRTAVEQALVQIWTGVLDLPRVSIEDRFFDLGGDSVKALGLMTGVEQRLGRSLPITLLFSNPTLAEMSEALGDEDAETELDPVLLPINAAGGRPPFFYAHGVFGDISSLTNIVPLLPAEQPLYGLQALGIHPQQQPDQTIEAMAGHYVQAIKRIQPDGPYRLGGFCFGGVVAYETARQLEQMGDKVSLLAIIEGSAPRAYHEPVPLWSLQRLNIMRHSAPQILRGNEEFGGWRLRQRWQQRFGRRKADKNGPQGRDDWDVEFDNLADFNASRPAVQRQLRDINVRAIEQYDPAPVAAQVTLFRARWLPIGPTLTAPIDPQRGWGRLAQGGVDVRYVDGSHIGVLRQPHAAKLASALAQALQETDPIPS